jgi:drug/metabolite transporter (DMT)-like permease
MLGVVMLTNPSLLFPSLGDKFSYDSEKYPHFYLGVLVGLFGSLSSGFAYLMMRRMGTNIHSLHGPLYFGTFNVTTCYITSLSIGEQVMEPYSKQGLILLTLVGIFGWIAQEGVSKAM